MTTATIKKFISLSSCLSLLWVSLIAETARRSSDYWLRMDLAKYGLMFAGIQDQGGTDTFTTVEENLIPVRFSIVARGKQVGIISEDGVLFLKVATASGSQLVARQDAWLAVLVFHELLLPFVYACSLIGAIAVLRKIHRATHNTVRTYRWPRALGILTASLVFSWTLSLGLFTLCSKQIAEFDFEVSVNLEAGGQTVVKSHPRWGILYANRIP